ncbi:MAG: DUF4340 domain-containing protein [Cytophagales bacterium]|nr:DUF4340 domain-containing protein [Cytophagales bacterium]
MLKNISSVKLIGILAALVLVYFGIKFFGGESRSKSFKAELVDMDTAKVTKVIIQAKGENLELLKEHDAWKVSIGEGKYAVAEKSSVKSTLNSLLSIKPSRIAAKKQDKWKEYQVDSAGTRVQVFEGGKATLDLVIGRFGFNQQAMQQQQQMMMGRRGGQQFFSYVRLQDENEVYVADNFMGMSINADASGYRNKRILSLTTDSISKIQFNYPADSSYVLSKIDSVWSISGNQPDSTATADYLSDIRYLSNSNFVDDVPASALVSPTVSMNISQNGKPDVMIKAFQHPVHKWILNSSENPLSYFADEDLIKKLFIGSEKLLTPTPE